MWNPNSSAGESRKDVSVSDSQKKIVTRHSSDNSGDKTAAHHQEATTGGDKFAIEQSCEIDSGFLSGPQLSGFEDSDYGHIGSQDSSSERQSQSDLSRPPLTKQETIVETKSSQSILDSGCIDVDISDLHIDSTESANTKDPMILDKDIDFGVSEWLCNMKIKDSGEPVNNLGRSGGDVQQQSSPIVKITAAKTSQQKRQHANIPGHGNPKHPKQVWEEYYQQDDDGDTYLHLACFEGFDDVVGALIRLAPHPCLLNIQNDIAKTALHLAVLAGHCKIVRNLLVAGAEPAIRDHDGNTPLHLACMFGKMDCVEALTTPITANEIKENKNLLTKNDKSMTSRRNIKIPQDLEQRNYDGEHCVHLAAENNHVDVLRYLVGFGADINAREGRSGKTPLHIAIEKRNENLAYFLLKECSKLNIEAETYAGLTAYQMAAANHYETIASGLEQYGAEPLSPPESDSDSDDDSDSQSYDRFGDPGYFVCGHGCQTINVA